MSSLSCPESAEGAVPRRDGARALAAELDLGGEGDRRARAVRPRRIDDEAREGDARDDDNDGLDEVMTKMVALDLRRLNSISPGKPAWCFPTAWRSASPPGPG